MNIILIDGITNIDEDLIVNYFRTKEKLERKRNNFAKKIWQYGAMVACFSLAIIVVVCVILSNDTPAVPSIKGDYGYTAGEKLYNIGGVSSSEYGTIKYIKHENHTITLELNKKTDEYIYATLFGYSKDIESVKNHIYCGTTNDSAIRNDVIIIKDGIKVYVNGVACEQLPQKAGTYVVEINYEKLKDGCEWIDSGIYVHGFEYFVVNLNMENLDPSTLGPDQTIPNQEETKDINDYLY